MELKRTSSASASVKSPLVRSESRPSSASATDAAAAAAAASTANTPHKDDNMVSFREVVLTSRRLYHFFCFMGILYPRSRENVEGSLTKYNFRYKCWYTVLYCMFSLTILMYLIYGVLLYAFGGSLRYPVLDFCAIFGVLIQCLLLVPVLLHIQKSFEEPRLVPDRDQYVQCIEVAVSIGYRTCYALILMQALFLVQEIISYFENSLGAIVELVTALVLSLGLYLIPCGVLAVLVVEQRQHLHLVQQLQQKAANHVLTPAEYLTVREEMQARDRLSVMPLMLASTAVNTLIGTVALFEVTTMDVPRARLVASVLYVLCVFGKQPLVLGVLLLQMSRVNEAVAMLVDTVAVPPPPPAEEEQVESKHDVEAAAACTVSFHDWGSSAKEQSRLALYLLLLERPMGSSILGFRPTHVELLSLAVSSTFAIVVAIFWALVFA